MHGFNNAGISAAATTTTTEVPSNTKSSLAVADWVVIAVHLTASIAVGLLVTTPGKGSSASSSSADRDSYFLAGRNAQGCAVAISLISGLTSGISFLGGPGYSYSDGAPIMMGYLAAPILYAPVAAHVVIPFYHNLQLTTVYEYLEMRFCRSIRTVAAVIFTIKTTIYLGMVLYAPALVLSTLTPLPTWGSILACGTFSTAWTIKGGMVAVIWTDFMQSIAMFTVAFLSVGFAIHACGGFTSVYDTLGNNHRLITAYYFGWHPLTPEGSRGEHPKEDFWSIFFGVAFAACAQNFTDQLAVQRWLTVKNVRQCQVGVYQTTVLNWLMTILVHMIGLSIYAYYHSDNRVDPVPHMLEDESDRVFPYFVLEVLPQGIPGLLIAGVLGSTMSVFSGGLNAAATSIYIDLLENRLDRGVSSDRVVAVTRKLTVVLAIVSISLAFLAAKIAGLVKQSVSLMGLTLGPLLGLNLCGMISTRANWQGALIGLAVGLTVAVYIGVSTSICGGSGTCPAQWLIGRVTFFWFGAITTISTTAATLLASLAFPPPSSEELRGLSVWRPMKQDVRSDNMESAALLGAIQ